MEQLYTRWGKELDPDHVLAEYPRPLMVRDSYENLNGCWDYAFTKEFRMPEEYDGKILRECQGSCSRMNIFGIAGALF